MHTDLMNGDLKKGPTDHACDALRYLLIAREPLTLIPLHLQPAKPHGARVAERTKKLLIKAMIRQNEQLEADQPDDPEIPPGYLPPNGEDDDEADPFDADSTAALDDLFQ